VKSTITDQALQLSESASIALQLNATLATQQIVTVVVSALQLAHPLAFKIPMDIREPVPDVRFFVDSSSTITINLGRTQDVFFYARNVGGVPAHNVTVHISSVRALHLISTASLGTILAGSTVTLVLQVDTFPYTVEELLAAAIWINMNNETVVTHSFQLHIVKVPPVFNLTV